MMESDYSEGARKPYGFSSKKRSSLNFRDACPLYLKEMNFQTQLELQRHRAPL